MTLPDAVGFVLSAKFRGRYFFYTCGNCNSLVDGGNIATADASTGIIATRSGDFAAPDVNRLARTIQTTTDTSTY